MEQNNKSPVKPTYSPDSTKKSEFDQEIPQSQTATEEQ